MDPGSVNALFEGVPELTDYAALIGRFFSDW